MSRFLPLASLVLILTLHSQDTFGQKGQVRRGLWFNGGLGHGSGRCEDCRFLYGLTGGLALGGTVSQRVLLGIGLNIFSATDDDIHPFDFGEPKIPAKVTTGAINALIRFHPWARGGFYLLGGLGLGTIDVDVSGIDTFNEIGPGLIMGFGYDFRFGTAVSVTPFLNVFGVVTSHSDYGVRQIGLGITVH